MQHTIYKLEQTPAAVRRKAMKIRRRRLLLLGAAVLAHASRGFGAPRPANGARLSPIAQAARDAGSELATRMRNSIGTTLRVPAGEYTWTTEQSIVIPADATLEVEFDPDAVIHLDVPVSSKDVETACIQFTGAQGSRLILRGGTWIGRATLKPNSNSRQHNIRIDNVSTVVLIDVNTLRAGMAGVLVRYASLLQIRGGRFNENSYAGCLFSGCERVDVGGNAEASFNGDKAPERGYGFSAGTRYDLDRGNGRVVINGARGDYNKRKPFDAHDAQDFSIDNVTVSGYAYSGIYAVSEDAHKRVKNIYVGPGCHIAQDRVWLTSLVKSNGHVLENELNAIMVGAYGRDVVDAGQYVIDNPVIIDPVVASSNRAILICTPDGAAPKPELFKVAARILDDARTVSTQGLIQIGSGSVNAARVIVHDVSLVAAWSSAAININGDNVTVSRVSGANKGRSNARYGVLSAAPGTKSTAVQFKGVRKPIAQAHGAIGLD
jgi:hypothetical protein